MVGLTRAFFYAGSRAVMAALWNVNDRFSAQFTERFYREIRSGRSTEEALRQAKLGFVAHPQFAHPFYWSSLVLSGDGTRVLYTGGDRLSGIWTGAGIAALFVVALAVVARKLKSRSGSVLHPDD
jgi:hypothetical protein